MKKIVIAMLLVLPLIIVASVVLAANIISGEVYIAVERVELNVDSQKTTVLELSRGELQLKATVFPTGAGNKNVVWSVENVENFGAGNDEPVTIDKTGLLKFSSYCAFDALVTTEEGGKTARANFVVECNIIKNVKITGVEGPLSTGEKKRLELESDPVDVKVDEITWKSDKSDIAAVDGNGVVTAKESGECLITAEAVKAGLRFSAEKKITVTPGVTKFGNAFAVSGSFDLDKIGVDVSKATIIQGGTLKGKTFVFGENATEAKFSVDGKEVVISLCQRDDVVIKNREFFDERTFYVGGFPPVVEGEYADVFRRDEKISEAPVSSDEKIAEVDGNSVRFVGKGEVRLTLGNDSVTLFVARPFKYIRLSDVNNDDKRGIAQETVYGTEAYAEGGTLAGYVYPVTVQYPEDAVLGEDYDITVDNEELAEVQPQGGVFIRCKPENGEETLTITVKAKYSVYKETEVTAVRRLKIIDGVNCETLDEVVSAASVGKTVILRKDIVVPEGESGKLELKANFYGNGYMWDATKAEKEKPTSPIIHIVGNGVKIINAHIRGDAPENINTPNGLSGTVVKVGDKDFENRVENAELRYCVTENGYYAVDCENADVYIDGCIMRNTGNFGLRLASRKYDDRDVYGKVEMNNCIMSNIVATAVGISAETDETDGGKDVLKKQSEFKQTGFLDIYNWQDITAARMLDRPFTGDKNFDGILKKIIGKGLEKEVSDERYSALRVTIDGKPYINLGVVTAGAMHECTTEPSFEDNRIKKFPLKVLDKFNLKPCVLYLYENTADIQPDSEFSENAETYARLRGEKGED